MVTELPKSLLQSEAKCEAIHMKMIFKSHSNKTYFHKKGLHSTSFWEWAYLEFGNSLLHENYISLKKGIYLISLRMGAYWKTFMLDTYFIKDGHLKKNLNVLGVDIYLINVRKGALLITLNWIGAYTKMTYSYISSHVHSLLWFWSWTALHENVIRALNYVINNNVTLFNLLLGPRNFFNDETGKWIPACLTIGIPISCTIPNVDSNSDFALVYVVTVALNEPGSVVVFVFISDPQHCVNRQGTTALGSIESDEPSLTAAATPSQIEVSLVNNTEGSIILGFSELTILQQQISSEQLFSGKLSLSGAHHTPYISFK